MMLPPITKKMHRTLRRVNDLGGATRQECWSATTDDGVWQFERIEDVGTPWIVIHKASGLDVRMYYGNLKKCRVAVAQGWAGRDIEAQAVSLLLTGKRYR